MRKRILAMMLTLAMCLGLAVPALAADRTICLTSEVDIQTIDPETFRPKITICETSADKPSKLRMTGDLTCKDEAVTTYFEEGRQTADWWIGHVRFTTRLYTSPGPVELEVTQGASKPGPENYLKSSASDVGESSPMLVHIDSVTYDEASQRYVTEKKDVQLFDGYVYADDPGRPVITIKEYMEDPDKHGVPEVFAGATATLTEPGIYFIDYEDNSDDGFGVYIQITGDKSDAPSAPAAPSTPAQTVTASPTSAPVLVNGEKTAFDAYEINGNNYFKLRDLAYVLNGTDKQFGIDWDGAANAISLTSGAAYTAVGGEMTGKGAGTQNAVPTTAKILLDGEEVSFTAYEIGGNNYFKLRDIGEAFDFGVDWDDAAQTIKIDTSKGYTAD